MIVGVIVAQDNHSETRGVHVPNGILRDSPSIPPQGICEGQHLHNPKAAIVKTEIRKHATVERHFEIFF